jgi:hypothetical protein
MRQETQLAVLGMIVRVLYTVQSIRNVLHYDAIWKVPESYGNLEKLAEYIVQNSMEASGSRQDILETTVSYKAWARLTSTLTHVITYELVTSGAKDDVMSRSL